MIWDKLKMTFYKGHFFMPENFETTLNRKNTTIFAETIVAPTGVSHNKEIKNPTPAHITDITAEHIITLLKLLKILIAVIDGKIINADIRSEPTRLIASTIIKAVIIAIIRL